MTTSKLVSLAAALLALGLGVPAWAEDPSAPAGEPPADAGAPVPSPDPWAAEGDGSAAATPPDAAAVPAPLPGGEAVLPAPEAEAVATETEPNPADAAPTETAAEAATDGAPTEAPAETPPASVLGALGHDAQGRPGRIHVVVRGDTLWDISNAYLGTPWVWPSIWQDNDDIANPHRIFPGDQIWITPWEMRKVSPEEAAALLAGTPAATDPGATEPSAPVEPPAPAATVTAEQPTYRVSNREMIGLVSEDEVDVAASVVANSAPRLMISQNDRVWIGLGQDAVSKGDQFTIYRVQEKVYDPDTGRSLGYHVNFLGWLEVIEPGEETSLAVVRESYAEIVIDDRLMPRETPIKEIAIRPSPGGVEGRVSFLPNQRTHMGSLDYVYLNRGTIDGVEVGSPLVVYREGFATRDNALDERVRVGDRVVADLLVVRAHPETSVALVRKTKEEIEFGDHFRGAQ
jgi:hypothetical protein